MLPMRSIQSVQSSKASVGLDMLHAEYIDSPLRMQRRRLHLITSTIIAIEPKVPFAT